MESVKGRERIFAGPVNPFCSGLGASFTGLTERLKPRSARTPEAGDFVLTLYIKRRPAEPKVLEKVTLLGAPLLPWWVPENKGEACCGHPEAEFGMLDRPVKWGRWWSEPCPKETGSAPLIELAPEPLSEFCGEYRFSLLKDCPKFR